MADDRPKFWMNESTGILAPVVEAYLVGDALTAEQVHLMRVYLRQWIDSPVWKGDAIEKLRATVEHISNKTDITNWLDAAMDEGIDPL
jgi:hypothetical protein